jgi:predicted RNA-binding Zn ribbon-like protein
MVNYKETIYPMRTLETLELVGGVLCLDFANTINSRRQPVHDYLQTYSDLAEWAVKLGFLSATNRNQLQKLESKDSKNAEHSLREALVIRDLIYQLFSKIARNSKPTQKDIDLLVESFGEAISHGSFVSQNNHFTIDWPMERSLDTVLWPILYSAGRLLLSNELIHVKECPNCGWLFLDTSKNQSRRWCSMNTCGSRDKMRRYLRRTRKK